MESSATTSEPCVEDERLQLIKARLQAAECHHVVHASCGGECTPTDPQGEPSMWPYCHSCDKRVESASVVGVPRLCDYEADVAYLLQRFEETAVREFVDGWVDGYRDGMEEERELIINLVRDHLGEGSALEHAIAAVRQRKRSPDGPF